MKKIFLSLCALLFAGPVFASVESFQLVTFTWDEEQKLLQPLTFGSGTAIDHQVILTNKHVVQMSDEKKADLVLLCRAGERVTRSVECTVPGVVLAVHDTLDVALVRAVDDVFFPKVRTFRKNRNIGDTIRIEGFPVKTDEFLNMGDSRTQTQLKQWAKTGGTLQLGGDRLTVTRGKITGYALEEVSNGKYYKTDAKVNFGNSGGAAFDAFGNFIGIPSLRDKEFNAFILEYHQFEPWVEEHKKTTLGLDKEIHDFYNKIAGTKTKKISKKNRYDRYKALSQKKQKISSRSRNASMWRNHSTSRRSSTASRSARALSRTASRLSLRSSAARNKNRYSRTKSSSVQRTRPRITRYSTRSTSRKSSVSRSQVRSTLRGNWRKTYRRR